MRLKCNNQKTASPNFFKTVFDRLRLTPKVYQGWVFNNLAGLRK